MLCVPRATSPCEPRQLSAIGHEMVSSWLLALLSLSAADGLRGGAMAGGPLLKSGAQSQRSEPVTPRAVVVLRGGGARRLRTHSTALSLSLSLHPRYACTSQALPRSGRATFRPWRRSLW